MKRRRLILKYWDAEIRNEYLGEKKDSRVRNVSDESGTFFWLEGKFF